MSQRVAPSTGGRLLGKLAPVTLIVSYLEQVNALHLQALNHWMYETAVSRSQVRFTYRIRFIYFSWDQSWLIYDDLEGSHCVMDTS